jgi:glycerol-3-phosphate dehydrogenase (NAD(P)+)
VTRIAILGGGSWGTALALTFSRSPRAHEISLWVHDVELAREISSKRDNITHLPGHHLPEQIRITHEIADAIGEASIVVGAMPSAHARQVYSAATAAAANAASLTSPKIFVSGTKGLERSTHLRMSEMIAQLLPSATPKPPRIAVLSGPSFAMEVAADVPTAVVIASQDAALAAELQAEFAAPNFRLYTNDDVLGVELAGAMKNVVAIAAGICQGLGSNPLAALITRGLAEMTRLAISLGARPETLSGLAGLGDLVLTCTGSLSRNRRLGVELLNGRPLAETLSSMYGVAEGVGSVTSLLALAQQKQIPLPITEQVEAILHHGKNPLKAIREVMERPLKRE